MKLADGTGDPEAKKSAKEKVEYAPGVLCAVEVPPENPIELDDDEIKAIKALNGKVAMYDMPSRREQLIRVWEARLFDRGYQRLLPRYGGGWEVPGLDTNYGSTGNDERAPWEIDIYSSYRKIICAALTREVPAVDFEPSDPDDDRDITAAASANKLIAKIQRDNKMKELQGEAARFLWTDGLCVHFSRYILDAQGYGYEPEPQGDVPEDEETGTAATAIDGAGDAGSDSRVSEADAVGEGGSASGNPDGESREDQTGTDADSEESSDESGTPKTGTPRGHELITVEGALNWKLPIKANSREQCSYARRSYEIPLAKAKARYPGKADKLTVSRSGGTDAGGDDLERLARINVMLGVEDNFITEDSSVYDVTIQEFFYRPEQLFDIPNEDTRNSILKKCPKGLFVVFANDTCLDYRARSMDDHITITFADAGDGIHRPGLGSPLIPPAKILNTLAELAYLYFVNGVPMTYMDDEMFDTEALRNSSYSPGGVRPFEANGQPIDGTYWFREQGLTFPEQLTNFCEWIMDEVAQLMSGAYPALFAGDTGSNDTAEGISIARDQALGRLGLPWRNIKEATAQIARQVVQMLAEHSEGTIKLGGVENESVNVADLKGNILCFPTTDENIPESYTEQRNRFDLMITDAATNPFFQKLLDSAANLKVVQQFSGFKDLKIPQLESWEQQLGEIAILFKGAPVPNPQIAENTQEIQTLEEQGEVLTKAAVVQAAPTLGHAPAPPQAPPELAAIDAEIERLTKMNSTLPPMVSSYPIDEDLDDHDVHAQTCLEMLRSPKGRAMKNGTAKDQARYANLRLHWSEHNAVIAEKAKEAAAGSAPPPKPPSFSYSANVKDLPPNEAAQVMQRGGITANAGDFAQQDQDEAIAKHPVTLGDAPKPGGSKS